MDKSSEKKEKISGAARDYLMSVYNAVTKQIIFPFRTDSNERLYLKEVNRYYDTMNAKVQAEREERETKLNK